MLFIVVKPVPDPPDREHRPQAAGAVDDVDGGGVAKGTDRDSDAGGLQGEQEGPADKPGPSGAGDVAQRGAEEGNQRERQGCDRAKHEREKVTHAPGRGPFLDEDVVDRKGERRREGGGDGGANMARLRGKRAGGSPIEECDGGGAEGGRDPPLQRGGVGQ